MSGTPYFFVLLPRLERLDLLLDFELLLLELPEERLEEVPELEPLERLPDRTDRPPEEDPLELLRERAPDEEVARVDGRRIVLSDCVRDELVARERLDEVDVRLTFEPAVGVDVVLVLWVDNPVLDVLPVREPLWLTLSRPDRRDRDRPLPVDLVNRPP